MAFGVGSGTQTPSLYQQATAPNAIGAFEPSVQNPNAQVQIYPIPQVGDLWIDLANNLLKRCSSVNPFTWVSVEGGGSGIPTEATPTDSGDHKNFTLPSSPNLLLLYLNGNKLRGSGADYTLAGSTITLGTAITPGTDVLDAVFW